MIAKTVSPVVMSNSDNDGVNWVDLAADPPAQPAAPVQVPIPPQTPLVMVETAFLASAASLIWLINYYFPFGPLLRLFFPIPIALLYLRRGERAAWMGALVSGLLLSILMGPTRSILYVIPYGLMGVQLGFVWRRGGSWYLSMFLGTILSTVGFLFRFWLLSILIGENLWLYVINQVTTWANWIVMRFGLLTQPDRFWIEVGAIALLVVNSAIYLFTVHLVALLMGDRLKTPIPRPPQWVQVLFEYEY